MKLPGFIQVSYAPEGEGSGAGAAPASESTPSAASGGAADASSSPSGAAPSSGGASPTPGASSPTSGEITPLPEDLFGGYGQDEGDDDPFATPPVAAPSKTPDQPATPAAATPPAPAATPAQPQPAQPSPQPNGQQPPAAAQPGPQEATQPQLPSPAEPGKRGAALLADIDVLAEHLSQQEGFKLSEKDIEALDTDIVGTVPKLMARTFVRGQAAALSQMEQVIPAMIERHMAIAKKKDESENAFYSAWPDIKKSDATHSSLVQRYAQQYRQMNPQATREEMIRDVGTMVMMAAKIVPSTRPATPGAPTPQTRKPPVPPFQPAMGGPAAPPAPDVADPWGGYAAEAQDEG